MSEEAATALSTKLQELCGIQCPGSARAGELAKAAQALAEKGVLLSPSGCGLSEEAKGRVARTPWTAPEGKHKLPTLSAAIEHSELCDAYSVWEAADEKQRNRLRGGSGPGVGKVWACQPATRSTTFGDQHWRQML